MPTLACSARKAATQRITSSSRIRFTSFALKRSLAIVWEIKKLPAFAGGSFPVFHWNILLRFAGTAFAGCRFFLFIGLILGFVLYREVSSTAFYNVLRAGKID